MLVGDVYDEHSGVRDTQFRRSYVKSGTGENFRAVWRLGKIVKAAKQKYKSQDCNAMNGWHSEALMRGGKDCGSFYLISGEAVIGREGKGDDGGV